MKVIPATLQTAYANLLQAHLNRPSFAFDGAPFIRKLNNKSYWYANQRGAPGAKAKQRYLGPDTEEMRERIEQMRTQQQNAADFRAYASSLVAQLRAGGITGPDRKTGPMLRALTNSGVFRLGGTLVGTHAFRHYDLVLGVHLSDATAWAAQTDDVDIASFEKLSMAIEDSADPDIGEGLSQLGFSARLTTDRKPSTSWILPDASYAIDFLTPSFKDDEGPVRLPALNMWAQSLHFLNYLIADPIDAVTPYMEGLLVKIPRPERYAIHKLIVSQRRRAGADGKRRKDIEQARTIIWAMAEDRPHELHQAIKEADSNGGPGNKWQEALDRALDISFESVRPRYNDDRDVIRFPGTALGEPQQLLFEISGEALDDHFEADRDGLHRRHEVAVQSRSEIESLMRWKFRHEPSPRPLVTTDDVSRWRRQKVK